MGITPLEGDTETNCKLPAWAGFTRMFVCCDSVPTVACTMTPPVKVESAVKVTLASPLNVLADGEESFPGGVPWDVIAKYTTVPSETGCDTAFNTFAVMFVVWPLIRFELSTLRVMEAALLVIWKVVEGAGVIEPTVAETVTEPEDVPV